MRKLKQPHQWDTKKMKYNIQYGNLKKMRKKKSRKLFQERYWNDLNLRKYMIIQIQGAKLLGC